MIIRVKTVIVRTTMNGGESDAESKPPRMQRMKQEVIFGGKTAGDSHVQDCTILVLFK
jgi:hypothetical protein